MSEHTDHAKNGGLIFRKKPVSIQAMQWTGDNVSALASWSGESWTLVADRGLAIDTLEGTLRADRHDWIIQGVKGEFYPCKPDIFEATYEPVL